jgi:hypothetical protein
MDLTDRLVAAYSFAAQTPGERVSLATVRLLMSGVSHEDLNPTLRALFGAEVAYQPFGFPEGSRGILRLSAADADATLEDFQGSVDVPNGGVDYTHMAIDPC